MDVSEKRKHTRLPIQIDADILLPNGMKIAAKTENISFGGLFLRLESSTETGLQPGMACDIHLLLLWNEQQVPIQLRCRTVHLHRQGIGFEFIGIESESYGHFKNLMVMNSTAPDNLLEELERYPGIIFEKG